MRRIFACLLGLAIGVNGLWMIGAPLAWYVRVPGVADTGPDNAHFIRDIGCAYLVAALALLWFTVRPKLGGVFLILHASVHLWDTATGREQAYRLLTEVPTVILPGFLVLWLGWPHSPGEEKIRPKA